MPGEPYVHKYREEKDRRNYFNMFTSADMKDLYARVLQKNYLHFFFFINFFLKKKIYARIFYIFYFGKVYVFICLYFIVHDSGFLIDVNVLRSPLLREMPF